LLGGSQDGRQLAWGSDGVWIRDAENNRVLFKLTDSSDSSVIWTSDGQRLATYRSGRGKSVQIYSAVDGSLQRKLSHDDRVMTVAWSPNGKDLATGSADHVVRIWDTRTGSLLRALYGHSAPVVSLAWSRDGRWLASGSGDNTARVWNVSTGELIHTIEAHTDTVTALAWSPDGRLATGSEDGLAKIWVLDPKVIEASACGYLSRNLSQGEWKELMPASFPYDPKHRTCSDLP
jgi:WD40 repeat protein